MSAWPEPLGYLVWPGEPDVVHASFYCPTLAASTAIDCERVDIVDIALRELVCCPYCFRRPPVQAAS